MVLLHDPVVSLPRYREALQGPARGTVRQYCRGGDKEAAASLEFLRVPPQNRLELLKKDRKGQWSIRINDQFRVCFEWRDGHAWRVEIVDYH